jgi:hypothetical protein
MTFSLSRSPCPLAMCLALVVTTCSPDRTTRTIELQTDEVTSPDVAVSPDGSVLVFSILGQLFTVPTAGGNAVQLTFGQFYHEDPSFAPDGNRLGDSRNDPAHARAVGRSTGLVSGRPVVGVSELRRRFAPLSRSS